MNETPHLVRKAADLIHCGFAWSCTHLNELLLCKMLLLRAVTSWCDVSVCQVGTLTLFDATGINNCYAHFHFALIVIRIKCAGCQA